MKTKAINLLSTRTLALCGMLLTAPYIMASEKDTLNAFDVKFIKHAAADGMAEAKLADLGTKKADRPEVKAYATMLVTVHTKANEDLAKLASTKGVELSDVVDPARAKVFQKLEKFSGTEFDSKFLAEMVSDHKKCVSNFEKASEQATDTDVKAFANEMLPTLKAHLEKAKELSNTENTSVNTSMDNTAADNTARNIRDRDGKKLTSLDQGNSKSDTEITAAIRKEIVAGKDLSVNAQNVKIITQNGKVTLRGPVNSEDEKRLITEIAGRVVQPDQVACELEVK
jgi:putative membrane protein